MTKVADHVGRAGAVIEWRWKDGGFSDRGRAHEAGKRPRKRTRREIGEVGSHYTVKASDKFYQELAGRCKGNG